MNFASVNSNSLFAHLTFSWLNTEWAQVEVIDLINDGSGLAFGIIGGRSTGVVVKTILPGGVADRDGRLQSGDHILQIGEVNLRGLGSEQVASVLRQCGVHVRMVVARPVESGSSEFQGIGSHAPIVPTKILGDPVELDRHLVENGYAETFTAQPPSNGAYSTPFIYSGQQHTDAQFHPISGMVDVVRDPKPIGPVLIPLMDPNLPETETYTVTLHKDDLGLGITVAGYVCEKEEISGIFVKSISKGSAADLTGKIKVNDRIVEVDGCSIIGQSNHQAVECLRNTKSTVAISFERYLRGPKYEQLQLAIRANELRQPSPPSPSSVSTLPKIPFSQVQMSSLTIEPELESRTSFDFDSAVLLETFPPSNENQEIVIGGVCRTQSSMSHESIYEKWRSVLSEDAEIVLAQLEKGADSGLGISLEGTVDVEDGVEVRPHHYIRNILPDGPVGRNGVLRSGDELLEVNGIQLMGLNHIEVVSILKQLPSFVLLVCARSPVPTRIIDTAQHKEAFRARNILADSLQTIISNRDKLVKAKSETSLASSAFSDMCSGPGSSRSRSLDLIAGFPMWTDDPVIVELSKGDHGLGFSILDYQDPMNPQETVIVIRSLVPGGVAQIDGRLIPGDRVIAVNDVNIEHASLDRAVQVLKGAARGLVKITVVKPLSANDAAMHNSQDTDQDEHTCLDEFQECIEEYQECLEVVQICLDGDNTFELSLDDGEELSNSSINNNHSSASNNNNNYTINAIVANNNNKLVSESEAELSYKSFSDVAAKLGADNVETSDFDNHSENKCQDKKRDNEDVSRSSRVVDGQKLVEESSEKDGYETCIDESLSDETCAKNEIKVDDKTPTNSDENLLASTTTSTFNSLHIGASANVTLSEPCLLNDIFDGRQILLDSKFDNLDHEDVTDDLDLKCYDNQDDSLDTDEFFLVQYPNEPKREVLKCNSEPNVLKHFHKPLRYQRRLFEYYNDYADCLELYNVHSTDNKLKEKNDALKLEETVKLVNVEEAKPVEEAIKLEHTAKLEHTVKLEHNVQLENTVKLEQIVKPEETVNLGNTFNAQDTVVNELDAAVGELEATVKPVKSAEVVANKLKLVEFVKLREADEPAKFVELELSAESEEELSVEDELSGGGVFDKISAAIRSGSAPDILDKSFVMLTYDPGPDMYRRKSAFDAAANFEEIDRENIPMTVTKDSSRRSVVDERETEVSNMLQKHWGIIRTVKIFREPNTSLGISIVGGKVDLCTRSESPSSETILGIFVKNVVPDSPAGRTGQLKTGDRILEVSGAQLRNASHERAVEVIRNAPNPVTFLVQSLIPWSVDNESDGSRYENNCSSPFPSPVSVEAPVQIGRAVVDQTMCNDIDSKLINRPDGAKKEVLVNDNTPKPATTRTTATIAVTVKKSTESSEESDDDEDVRDLEGRTVSAMGHEIDRASAANIKRSKEEIAADAEQEDDFGYTMNKVKKKYANLGHTIMMVQLERGGQGLGLSLAGHKDRNCMAVFVCGLNPTGAAFKAGSIQVGDEILEVNGVVLHGRCHLNASAIIKGLSGPIFKVIILRRKTAIDDIAVRPITQFPVSLAEETSEEAFSNYPNVRTVIIKKGTQSLGIMIIEGKHAEVGQGIFISDLQEGSAAEKAGLEIGEMILAVNKDSLLGSNYDNAANLLKRTEGLVTLVVSNPGKKPATPTATDDKSGLKASGPPTRPTTPVPEPPADPASCPINPGKDTTIEITSDNKPLGIFFIGGKDTPTTGGIVIVEIYANAIAEKDSRLQPGDQILDVNGIALKDVTYNTALQALRQTLPKMKLIVFRPEKIEYQTIDVEFVKKPGKGLGLSIVGRNSGKGVYVAEVLNGGPADVDGKIAKGDLIVSVSGQNVESANAEEAGTILKTASGKVAVKLHRYKPNAR